MKEAEVYRVVEPDGGDWRDKANCKTLGNAPFFNYNHGGNAKVVAREIANVMAICKECSVKTECLRFAMANEIPYGIWGGLTAKERNELLKVSVTGHKRAFK